MIAKGIKQGFGNTQAAMLLRHEWNLIKEMIVLVFFDPRISFWMLELMAFMLHSLINQTPTLFESLTLTLLSIALTNHPQF